MWRSLKYVLEPFTWEWPIYKVCMCLKYVLIHIMSICTDKFSSTSKTKRHTDWGTPWMLINFFDNLIHIVVWKGTRTIMRFTREEYNKEVKVVIVYMFDFVGILWRIRRSTEYFKVNMVSYSRVLFQWCILTNIL